MKRNIDLIRNILLQIEKSDNPRLRSSNLNFDTFTEEEVLYHLGLLADAGLINGLPVKTLGAGLPGYVDISLNWEGHDLLDAIRDETVWTKTKQKLGTMLATASLEVIKAAASGVTKEMLNLQ